MSVSGAMVEGAAKPMMRALAREREVRRAVMAAVEERILDGCCGCVVRVRLIGVE